MTGPAIDVAAWSSPWRWRSPGDKVLLGGGLVLAALLLPTWPTCPIVAAVALVLTLGPGRVPLRVLARAARAAAAFILLGVVTIAVTWQSAPPRFGPTVTAQSLDAAVDTLAHATAGTAAVLLVAATTPMTDLLAWARRRGLPEPIVDVAGLVYRMLFILLATLGAVRTAQAARLGYADRRATMRSAATLTAAVLVRSFDRARRLEAGLAGRGFEGDLRVLDDERPTSRWFVVATVTGLIALVGVGLVVPVAGHVPLTPR
jgi:cobalt/nickel transport system permease protein